MRYFYLFAILILTSSCTTNKGVYWCGDHQCINKKEKEAYFKKTMIVEMRQLDKSKRDSSEYEKLLKQAKIDEKTRIQNEKQIKKQIKIDEKKRIKDEKKRLKEEKKKLKNEEKMSKETQESVLEEKQQPEETVSIDQIDEIEEIEEIVKTEENFNLNSNEGETSGGSSFDKIYDMITKRNDSKSYPDINDISE